ncbi:hypothetical protein ACQCR9_23585, partial [Ralstonia pseudosolanacearum]
KFDVMSQAPMVTRRHLLASASLSATPGSALTCQTTLAEPAGGEIDAVVTATQGVVRQWSQRIAESVRSLETPGKDQPAWCR